MFHLLQYSLSLSLSLSKWWIKTHRDIIGTYSSKTVIILEQRKIQDQECGQLKALVEELESMSLSKLQ
jgi:hypothetical protein